MTDSAAERLRVIGWMLFGGAFGTVTGLLFGALPVFLAAGAGAGLIVGLIREEHRS